MPAPIVMACADAESLKAWSTALERAGEQVATFTDPFALLNALEAASKIRVLVICVDFGGGKPTGITVARMARYKRPHVQVLFAGPSEYEIHAAGLGDFKVEPVEADEIVGAVQAMMDAQERRGHQ